MVKFPHDLWDGLPALNNHARTSSRASKEFVSFLRGVAQAEEQYIKTISKLATKRDAFGDDFLGTSIGSSMAGVMDRFLAFAQQRQQLVRKLNDQVIAPLEGTRDMYTRGGKKLHHEGQQLEEKLQLARAARESAKQKYEHAAKLVDMTRADTFTTPVNQLISQPTPRLRGMYSRLVRVARERDVALESYRTAVAKAQAEREERDAGMSVVLRTLQSHESQRLDGMKAALVRLAAILAEASSASLDVHRSIQPIADSVNPSQDLEIIGTRLSSGKHPVAEESFQPVDPNGSANMSYRSFLTQFRVRNIPAPVSTDPPKELPPSQSNSTNASHNNGTGNGDIGLVEGGGAGDTSSRTVTQHSPDSLYGVDQESEGYTAAWDKVQEGLDAVFSSQELDMRQTILLSELLSKPEARAAFIRNLNQRRQQPRVREQASFRALSTWVRCAVSSGVAQEDYAAVRNLLNMSGTFYTESTRPSPDIEDDDDDYVFVTEEQLARYYIQDELREDPLWRDIGLWECIFEDALRYGGDLSASVQPAVDMRGQGDSSVAYSQLVALSWSMSEFGLPGGEIQAFVDKLCLQHGVDPTARDLLAAQIRSLTFVEEPSRPDAIEKHVSPAMSAKGGPNSPTVSGKGDLPSPALASAASPPVPVDTASFEERLILAKKLKDFGNELFKDGQYYEAIRQYLQAVNLIMEMQSETPGLADQLDVVTQSCHLNIAASALQMKDYHLTVEFCRKAMASDTGNIKARFRLGLAYARLGKIVLALRQIRTVVQFVPDDQQALSELARLQELFRLCRLLLVLGER